MNYANLNRPNNFNNYLSQNGSVNYIKSVIENNNHPNGIIINGLPGVGKTTLAQLYTRATLCENRKEGSSKLCGKCNVCKTGEHPNITYYRITEATAFKDVVSDLISISKSSPALVSTNPRADNYRRFVLIDELQNCTRQSISPFLDSLEFASDDTTVVLISMDLNKLDPIVRDAIESRCVELSLDTLSFEVIANKIFEKHPEVEYEALVLIAKLSNGNMRKAWSIFEYFATQVSDKQITSDLVYEQKYGGLNKVNRESFFNCLLNKSWQETKKTLNNFKLNSTPENIVKVLLDDLVEHDLTFKGIELLSTLSVWLQSQYKIPIEACFINYQSVELLKDKEVKFYSKPINVLPLEATPSALKNANSEVLNQLSAISGKTIKSTPSMPKCLVVKTWKELLEGYDKYN